MSEEKEPASRDADEELKVVYQEVCSSFHAIADFRAKLLGFLPLASGAGIFLLLNRSLTDGTEQYLLPIGVFGFAVTLGLFFYELRGIQKCWAFTGSSDSFLPLLTALSATHWLHM